MIILFFMTKLAKLNFCVALTPRMKIWLNPTGAFLPRNTYIKPYDSYLLISKFKCDSYQTISFLSSYFLPLFYQMNYKAKLYWVLDWIHLMNSFYQEHVLIKGNWKTRLNSRIKPRV